MEYIKTYQFFIDYADRLRNIIKSRFLLKKIPMRLKFLVNDAFEHAEDVFVVKSIRG